MKKGKIITLSIVGGLVLVLVLFSGATILNGTCFTKYNEDKTLNNWMSDISDETKLEDIVMPGSHDAGTVNMNWLGNTQNYSIKEQLMSGSRYFDIRVNKLSEDNLVIFHGPINGEKFLPILNDIKNFILENPSETILLDFQHFENDSEINVKEALYSTLFSNNLLLTKDSALSELEYISSLKLKDTRGKCIAFFPANTEYTKENYLFSRAEGGDDSVSMNSYYEASLNKLSSEEFINKGLPQYIESTKKHYSETGYKGLFVLQSQLTDGLMIFGPYSREKSHSDNLSNYINSLKDSSDLPYINIIMRDFINVNKCEEIINLNYYK